MAIKTLIEVNLQHEATHFWPESDAIPEVSFLKHPHRHIFHIRLRKKVSHDNRQIEIIQFKRQVEDFLSSQFQKDFGSSSCEMIAKHLLEQFKCDEVRTLEDGENGALVIKE